VNLGSGDVTVANGSGGISGLLCNTPYHFRAAATNVDGTTHGADLTFTSSSGSCYL
jgi:hypothetical protein